MPSSAFATRSPIEAMPQMRDFPAIGFVEATAVAEAQALHRAEPLASDEDDLADAVLAEIGDWLDLIGERSLALVAFSY